MSKDDIVAKYAAVVDVVERTCLDIPLDEDPDERLTSTEARTATTRIFHILDLADQLDAADPWPEKSEEWHRIWILRLAWYKDHDGDMTGAPDFPIEEAGS